MGTRAGGLKVGLLVIAGLAAFLAFTVALGVQWGVAFWNTALAGAVVLAVTAIWSRGARFALGGLIMGAVLGGATAGGLMWNEPAGGWEGLVRAIAVMSGMSLGAVVGGLGGWLWALRTRR